jgi:hypothetical protein
MKDDFPENDPLWNLLGKASHRSASPCFARNVLREIRQSAAPTKSIWVFPRWLAPAAFAAILIGFALTLDHTSPNKTAAPLSPELAEYFDAAAMLDQLSPDLDFTPAHLAGL